MEKIRGKNEMLKQNRKQIEKDFRGSYSKVNEQNTK